MKKFYTIEKYKELEMFRLLVIIIFHVATIPISNGAELSIKHWDDDHIPSNKVNRSDFLPISEWKKESNFHRYGRPIARLKIARGNKIELCTGFMVTESLMMTAAHCVKEISDVDAIKAEFDYNGTQSKITSYDVNVAPEYVNVDLDAAVLEVNGFPGKNFGVVSLSNQTMKSSDNLFLIHHPDGQAKTVTITGCTFRNLSSIAFQFNHTCKSMGGSSGAPLFNDTGAVIGLHHSAKPQNIDGSFNLSDTRGTLVSPIAVETKLADFDVDLRSLHKVKFLRKQPCEFKESNRWVTMVLSLVPEDNDGSEVRSKMRERANKMVTQLRGLFPEYDFEPLPPFTSNLSWGIVAGKWISEEEAKMLATEINSKNRGGIDDAYANHDQQTLFDPSVGCVKQN